MMRRMLTAAALVGLAALPASADSFPGVTWTTPSLMIRSEAWSTNCPARCIAYQGDEDRGQDSWPLIVVHAPVTGAADDFFESWSKAIETQSGESVELVGSDSRALEDGNTLYSYLAYTEEAGYGGRDISMLLIHGSGDVLVTLEIKAFDDEDIAGRLDAASAMLESLRVDPARARTAISGDAADLASKAAAIDEGFLAGGRVRLYMQSQIMIGSTYGLGGLQITNDRVTTAFALLPGGVLLTGLPDNFRKPDLVRMKADGEVGAWTKTPAGYAFELPDGTLKSATINKAGELVIGNETYPLVDPLTAREMPGRYETISVSTAGGLAVGNSTMIASRFDGSLVLQANGQFEQGRDSYVSISGPDIGGGTGSNDLVTGRWTFDPASYMLTLKPDDGTPAISGLFFCYFCDAATINDENWDWNVLGGEKWWRANKDD